MWTLFGEYCTKYVLSGFDVDPNHCLFTLECCYNVSFVTVAGFGCFLYIFDHTVIVQVPVYEYVYRVGAFGQTYVPAMYYK